MALQSITNINVDFYDKKYILINAKQLDKNSRFLSVTCYNHGEAYHVNSGEHSAYIRYKKSDGNSVFNFCEIDRFGKIKVELTEQMLASDGICYADLVIVNKGRADVDADTGEIVAIDNASVLSTMTFCIDVSETAVVNSDIESTYEFNVLNETLEKYEADYKNVVTMAKSWAIGETGNRNDEDVNNAKYYSELSSIKAGSADASEAEAKRYFNLAQSYAVGNSQSGRAGEDTDNAEYYYKQVKNVADSLSGGFIVMGTISFSELETADKVTGFTYNIKDDFVTNDSFAEGSGKSYTAGTNVFCRSDGMWDCLGGAASPTATVDEVKSYLGI